MSNIHYTKTFDVAPGSKITSQGIEDQFLLIEQGFDSVDTDVAAKLATRDATIAGLTSGKADITGEAYTGTHDFTGASSVDVPTPAAGVVSSKAANMSAVLTAVAGLYTTAPVVVTVSGTSQTAVAGSHYILTGALTTVTLPSAVAGDTVWITWTNGLTTNVVARTGGNTIMGLAESMTLDASQNGTVQLRAVSASDWRIL